MLRAQFSTEFGAGYATGQQHERAYATAVAAQELRDLANRLERIGCTGCDISPEEAAKLAGMGPLDPRLAIIRAAAGWWPVELGALSASLDDVVALRIVEALDAYAAPNSDGVG